MNNEQFKIAYLAKKRFPSRLASCVNIINMVSGFNTLEIQTKLFCEKDEKFSSGELKKYYGVENNIDVVGFFYKKIFFKKFFNYSKNFQILKDFSPNLIYFRDHGVKVFGKLILKLGIPFAIECHLPIGKNKRFLDKLINSEHFKNLIVINNNLKEYYLNLYPYIKDKIFVYHDAAQIPSNFFNYEHSRKSDEFNIGYIGNLYKGKCMQILLEIVPFLSKKDKIYIFGGTEKEIYSWKTKLKKMNINNIIFYGYVSRGSLESKLENIDCFIAPFSSRVSASGGNNLVNWMSPLKIFEYMSFRRPIICTKIKGLSDVLRHEDNALLCESNDTSQWIKAIERIKMDKILAERLVETAYSDFLLKYNWNTRAKEVIKQIKQ